MRPDAQMMPTPGDCWEARLSDGEATAKPPDPGPPARAVRIDWRRAWKRRAGPRAAILRNACVTGCYYASTN